MKAVKMYGFGGPEVLRVEEIDEVKPGPREVAIHIKAASLNHVDVDIRKGVSGFNFPLPHVLGIEGAGLVAAVGGEVDGLAVGDPVAVDYVRKCGTCIFCRTGLDNMCENRELFGEHIDGTYTEYLVVPATSCIKLPHYLSPVAAVASMVAFGTAWHGLLNAGRLTAGETVLINSVGSGVASAALQVVVLAGGRAIVTASADDKLEVAKADGAMAGINYRKENVRERVLELTDGRGVDLVFDVVGGDSFLTGLGLLSPGKRLVCIGAHGGEHVDLNLIDVFRDHVSIIGSHTQTRAELEKVLAEVAAGRLSPRVARTYPLEAVADAHSLLESRTAYGKIVLQNE